MSVSRTLSKTEAGYLVHFVNDPSDPDRDGFGYGYKDVSFKGFEGITPAQSLALMLLEAAAATDTPVSRLINKFEKGKPISLPVKPERFTTADAVLQRWEQMRDCLPQVAQAFLSDLPRES